MLGLPTPKPMRIVMQPETVSRRGDCDRYANIRKESFTGSHDGDKGYFEDFSRNVIDVTGFDPSLRVVKNNEMGQT